MEIDGRCHIGEIFCFVAFPRLRNLIQNVGCPVPAENQHKMIQTNQPMEKK